MFRTLKPLIFVAMFFQSVPLCRAVAFTNPGFEECDGNRVKGYSFHDRPGTPVTVRSDNARQVYEEGRDFATVEDERLDFRFDHEAPALKILPGSRIKDGERLRVSYYHGMSIYGGQVSVCMSDPQVYDGDTLENPRAWLEVLNRTPKAVGIMYTTWQDKYELLSPFGDLITGKGN